MTKRPHFISFEEHLRKEMKNPVFRKAYEEAGERLRARYEITVMRHKKKMTQKQLAKKMKMNQTSIARIEAGEQNLTIGTLKKFARAFGKKLQIRFV